MTARPRSLSGRDVVGILGRFGFQVVATRGSHAKLRREVAGRRQVVTVPLHRALAHGTLRAIFRQVSAFVDPDALRSLFFVED